MMRYFLSATLALAMQGATADWSGALEQVWEQTKNVSGELYQTTRNAGQRAWTSTLGLFSSAPLQEPEVRLDDQDAAFRKILAKTLSRLEDGVALMEAQERAPKWALLRKDQADLQADFNDLLDDMTAVFADDAIIRARERIFVLRQSIATTKQQILKLKEQQLAAPRHDRLQSTKQDYQQQIAEERRRILDQQAEIEAISGQFIEKLQALGITLTPREADVLLARVDSRDIVQMAVVFNTAKKIDVQLLSLMAESGEDVGHAKRYYGMHVVLLELLRYMQSRYITDIEERYVPRLKDIIANTRALYQNSNAAYHEEQDAHRRRGYAANMRANQLTIDTAMRYIELLEDQRAKVATARGRVQRDLRLAKNTYATVRYSAELLAILQTSQPAFDALMGLQVPAMEPFTNLRMQREFEVLSQRIARQS